MKKMKELIKTYLTDVIRRVAPKFNGKILVEPTLNKDYGDYTTNVAFSLAKIIKKSPQAVAEEIIKKIIGRRLAGKEEFSKIDSKNGFINFYLSEECLRHQLGDILKQKNKYGFSTLRQAQGKKIQIEFISANPTGPLTVGNGRGGFYGDTLASVLETQGYKVTREFYINDRGGQILALGRSIKLAQRKKLDLKKNELVNLYKGGYINNLSRKISEDLSIEEAGQKAAELILETYIKPVIKKIGINYDVWFSEKSLYQNGIYEKVMNDLMKEELVYEKDGATFMETSKLGDSEDRVLIKSNGDETYFMSDILYHFNKFKVRKFDKVIDIWGADHHGDVPRISGALKALGIDLEKLKIILTQFVRLVSKGREVKISKRAGNFVTLEELIDEVGLDAARFLFLMYSPNTHMDFDIKLAKERSQKNPVYYVQYAHARMSSILRKAKLKNFQFSISNFQLLKEKSELNLIRKLVGFSEILSDIGANYEVHRLPKYALELAREFHNFYEKERVISENKDLTSARLALIAATKIVLANSLNLMGIKAPDRM